MDILRQRVIIEAFGCNNLNNIDTVYDFLISVADKIGATLYSQPIVMKTPGQGVTGIAVLLESAEVMHSWPEHGFMDFYLESCKEFDYKPIYTLINKFFTPQKIKLHIHDKIRG